MKPSKITVSKDRRTLTVQFKGEGEQAETHELEAELLRVRSPSAEVQGHSPEQRVLVHGKRDVGIMKLHPIGNYAIRIEFDDLHNTGIFTWPFLLELGRNKQAEWAAYESELAQAGRSREPARLR
ncbi:MAG: DUF971 domain-containing protein [Nitratireductor sp.]|nr:DUF971 domain-containing protein [Nitratireductor sp.]